MPHVVHVHDVGRFVEQMIVDRSDFKTAFAEPGHNGIDFSLKQDQVAHNHRIRVTPRECSPRTQGEARLEHDAVERHV